MSKIPAEMKVKKIMPAFSCYHKIITEHCIIKPYLQLHFKHILAWLLLTELEMIWQHCAGIHTEISQTCAGQAGGALVLLFRTKCAGQEPWLCCEMAGTEL